MRASRCDPRWSIHTAFMQFSIDVVFLDQDQVVLRIDPNVGRSAPCRAVAHARSSSSQPASARGAGCRRATASPGRRVRRAACRYRQRGSGRPARGAAGKRSRRQPRRPLREAVAVPARWSRARDRDRRAAIRGCWRSSRPARPASIVLDAHDEVASALRTANARAIVAARASDRARRRGRRDARPGPGRRCTTSGTRPTS